jgi:hypothetical protein
MSPRPITVSRGQFHALRSALPRNLPRGKGRAEPKAVSRMNKGEARYAEELDRRIAAGHLAAWWFEGVTLKMAPDTHYRPDFLVVLADGTLELHEVKGRKGDTFYATEDGWLKLKLVAEQFPFTVRVVWPAKDGHWNDREL